MAARTSAGTGVVVTIALLSITSLALFITTVVFFGQMRAKQNELDDASQRMNDLASVSERDSARLQTWIQQARGEGESFVGYMLGSYRDAMLKSIGSPEATPVEFEQAAERLLAGDAASLAALLSRQDQEIANLRRTNETAVAARNAATNEVEASNRRISALEERHRATIDALRADIGRYQSDINEYIERINDYESRLAGDLEGVRSSATETENRLREQLAELRNQNLVLRDQLQNLRATSDGRLTPRDEAALVDGEVLGRSGSGDTVELSIGSRDKVQIGMSFSVFTTAADIRANEQTGQYQPGKATIEVIRVAEGTATARVLRSQPGNPIVRGDVIANPIYDPNKVYSFLVFGLFDTNADGRYTSFERDGLVALIEGWGGSVSTEMEGSLDFLVLGQRPALPPEPQPGDPLAVIQEYVRKRDEARRYDALFEQAQATGIPVLNENRLYTLLGKAPGEVR